MKRILEFFNIAMIITGLLLSTGIMESKTTNGKSVGTLPFIVMTVVFIVIWVKFFYLKRKKKNKEEKEDNLNELDDILRESGLINISKKVDLVLGQALYVDDVNKKWGLFHVGKNSKVFQKKVFSYSDLIKYELVKETELKTKGRTGSTIVGGVTFGVIGAMAGSSRSRKTKEKVKKVNVNITVDSLETPSISVLCNDMAKANEITGVLEYILNHK